ncbi:exonuclease [Synechococcus phage Yong-M3-232]|nr:exonuclease [Synechococcus phage Yong-M3-232]
MVAIPEIGDPTLQEADRALERAQERRHRSHLGMSQIGRPCEREIWYSFRWVQQNNFDAATLKRFEDGHASELVAVRRLKMVPGIELHEVDERGEQFRFEDFGGHFSGSCDGAVLGILQAPKTWHILEIKASAKHDDLDKAKKKVGDKAALADWNPTYYAQAALYMHYAGLDRHYLVCVSPGARKWTSVRTEADPVHAEVLRAKAERIIFTDQAPNRIGGPDSFTCRWCDFHALCHGSEVRAERNCRTCLHSTPERDGTWRCEKFGHTLSKDDQVAGCPEHRFLPSLVPGEQVDAGEWGITYRTIGGEWIDHGQAVVA